MSKKIIWVILATVIIAVLITVKLVVNKKEINENNRPNISGNVAVSVTTATVKKLPVKIALVKTGTLLPLREVSIASTAQGKIEKMNFDLGTKVNEGQVLARIDSKLKELALQQAELSIAKLEKDYARFQSLLEGNAATETNVNDIKFNLENAKNQAEQLRKQINDSYIKAPITGIAIRKNLNEGEFVNFGTPLGTVVDVSKLKVQVQVSEKEVYDVKEKQSVKITSDLLPGILLTGEVTYVSPRGDETHNYLVEITLKNTDNSLKAGTFVYVDFSGEPSTEALQIPRSALGESLKNTFVYVVVENKAVKRNITVGREIGEHVEIIEGLQAGETVVTNGQINLSDGALVNVASNE